MDVNSFNLIHALPKCLLQNNMQIHNLQSTEVTTCSRGQEQAADANIYTTQLLIYWCALIPSRGCSFSVTGLRRLNSLPNSKALWCHSGINFRLIHLFQLACPSGLLVSLLYQISTKLYPWIDSSWLQFHSTRPWLPLYTYCLSSTTGCLSVSRKTDLLQVNLMAAPVSCNVM